MVVAKIIVEGPSKSFKTTLANLIANALVNEQIEVLVVDSDPTPSYAKYDKLLDALYVSGQTVTVETRQTNRGPQPGTVGKS